MTKKFVFITFGVFMALAAHMVFFPGSARAIDVCFGTGTTCSTGETLMPSYYGQQLPRTYDIILTNHTTANDIAGFRIEYNFDSSLVTCSSVTLNTAEGLADYGGEIECQSTSGHIVIAGVIDILSNVDYKSAPLKIGSVSLLINVKADVDVAAAMSQVSALTYVATKSAGSLLPSHPAFNFHAVISDTTPPSSSVSALSSAYGVSTFPVTYTASDNNAVVHVDLYSLEKDASGNIVKDWTVYSAVDGLPGTLTFPQTVNFTGTVGNTYCFKSVAFDLNANQSAAPPFGNGDACARISKYAVLAAQKPANSSQLGIVVLTTDGSGASSQTPSVSVTAGSCAASSVTMTQTVTKTFIGTYTFQSGCTGTTKVCVNSNEECISFSSAKLSFGSAPEITTGYARAAFAPESVKDDVFVTLFEETGASYPDELKPAAPLYRAGPEGQELLKDAAVSIDLSVPLSDGNKEKTKMYAMENGSWKMLATDISPQKAEAKTRILATYGVFTDATPPSITNVSLTENLIEAKISDNGSGVNKDGFSVRVNGIAVPFAYDSNTKMLKAVTDSALTASGSVLIEIQAKDAVSNAAIYKESKPFTSAPFDLQRVFAAPNPVRTQGGIALMMDVDEPHGKLLAAGMMSTKIELYSLAGKLVAVIPYGMNAPASTKQKVGGAVRMKQKLEEGVEFPVLPNGVYIFRVSITDSQGKTISKVGKLVVAR